MEIRFIDVKAGKRHARPLPCVVGRGDDVGFRVKNDSVSRRHCEFTHADGTVLVTDLGSTNGTFVHDARLAPHAATAVPKGATVRLGGILLRVEYAAAQAVDSFRAADTVPLADADLPELEPVVTATEGSPVDAATADVAAPFPEAAPAEPAADFAGLADAESAPAADGSFDFLGAEAPPPESDDKLDDFFKSIS